MLFSLVEWIDSQNSYLDRIQESLDPLQLVYERDLDTCEQHKSTFLRCCDYLSVAPAEPVTRHLRQSAPNWTDDIANIAEIVAKFQGTPFEALVDS
ncbi:hypothetical protein Mal33_53530 [Rosistilla oblonga]|uniref:Uncharacterized protein n=1 Tax=Rosistilla oblonga TaxID=2527990 RepID=A0A518J1W1_9BACT|nr:hypothetical protein Mal33_53530 [Rosistilla oblonga]